MKKNPQKILNLPHTRNLFQHINYSLLCPTMINWGYFRAGPSTFTSSRIVYTTCRHYEFKKFSEAGRRIALNPKVTWVDT